MRSNLNKHNSIKATRFYEICITFKNAQIDECYMAEVSVTMLLETINTRYLRRPFYDTVLQKRRRGRCMRQTTKDCIKQVSIKVQIDADDI